MKKTVIAFGILCSVMFTSVNANTEPTKGRKVVKTTIKNLSPLSVAVAKGNYEMAQNFLEFGADINQVSQTMEMTPLMFAARYNNLELLKLLVDNGAETATKSKIGITALEYARLSNATDAIKYLEKL